MAVHAILANTQHLICFRHCPRFPSSEAHAGADTRFLAQGVLASGGPWKQNELVLAFVCESLYFSPTPRFAKEWPHSRFASSHPSQRYRRPPPLVDSGLGESALSKGSGGVMRRMSKAWGRWRAVRGG